MYTCIYLEKERNEEYFVYMKIINKNDMNILDLPDEMLLAIFRKMNMIDVFYSLVDVNRRFHGLVLDLLCIFHLNLTNQTLLNEKSTVANQLVDRICEKLLIRSHQKINKLTVQPITMKCVLLPINYSQLYSLSLVNFEQKMLLQNLTGIFFIFKTKSIN